MKTSDKFLKEKFEFDLRILLEDKWLALTSLIKEKKSAHFLPLVEFENLNAYFAIDEEGARKVFFPFNTTEKFKADKKSQSIQIKMSTNDFHGKKETFIEVACKNADKSQFIYNKFNTLLAMVFVKIKFENKDNYKALVETIQEWRDFFRIDKKKLLSAEEIRGLIGELLFLKDVVTYDKDSFNSWHGPEAERHDFRKNNISIEVKTTSSKNKVCKISSVEQLEVPQDAKLYCQYYQLEQDDQGYSIPRLIKDLQDLGIAKIDIERKLNDLNYDFEHDNHYDDGSRRYRVLLNEFYEVNEQFPKITKNSFINNKVPKNVLEIVYKINLNDIPLITFEEKQDLLKIFTKS